MKISKREVVVTGLGVVSPMDCGSGLDSFWKGICQGRNAIKPLSLIPARSNYCRFAGEAKDFERFLERRYRKDSLRCSNLFRHALIQAVEDARCASLIHHAGISFGSILGEIDLGQKYIEACMQKRRNCVVSLQGYPLHAIPERLAQELDLSGPCLCVSTTCSSSGDAIGLALREIQCGRSEIMIAGGADCLSKILAAAFASSEAIAQDGIVRPFDKNRKGFCVSEGAGVVILEEANHAKKRKASIYCKIKGYGASSDAYHLFRPDKDGRGLSRAIQDALSEAKFKPSDIDYINAHGVATLYNDLAETRAIKRSFGRHAKTVRISSIKSMIGHTMGACSVIDLICCAKVLREGVIPATTHYQTPDPECDLDYTVSGPLVAKVQRVLSLSAGLGGQNCVLAAERLG